MTEAGTADEISVTGDLEDVQRWFEERGLTDGLPIVPPTKERVAKMVAAVELPPHTSLGAMPTSRGEATIEKLAINAVMAGLRPAAFPVVVAAIRAMLHEEFNLFGIQATTHPVAPLTVVHGPIARELNVHGGAGMLGPGFAANATIGRAIRMILLNVGSTYPGEGDKSTQGSPAKYTFCIAENVAESRWAEFHTTRGFEADESAVTVIATEAPNNLHDPESAQPTALLEVFVGAMARMGLNQWFLGPSDYTIILCPEHAALLESNGWTRTDVQHYLFARVVRPVEDIRRGGMWTMRDWPVWMNALGERPGTLFPIVRDPNDFHLLVAGGPGKHSSLLPSFSISKAMTVPV
jgi:hypothetical protein